MGLAQGARRGEQTARPHDKGARQQAQGLRQACSVAAGTCKESAAVVWDAGGLARAVRRYRAERPDCTSLMAMPTP